MTQSHRLNSSHGDFGTGPPNHGVCCIVKRKLSRKLGDADERESLFQLFFLKDDEDQTVEVEELKEIDFQEVDKRLEKGESVFITAKHKQKATKKDPSPNMG